jgi:orotate phosphoribosyltransferase
MIYGSHKNFDGDSYGSFVDLDVAVRTTIAKLHKKRSKFDAIVVTGISGIVVGAPVALSLKKQLLVLRKEETFHGINNELIGRKAIVAEGLTKILFLDDLISTGATFRRCKAAVEEYDMRLVGTFLYERDRFLTNCEVDRILSR